MAKRLSKSFLSIKAFNVFYVFPEAPSHNASKKIILIRKGNPGLFPPHDPTRDVFKLRVKQCHG